MRTLLIMLAGSTLLAQDVNSLRNEGSPMRVPFACSEDDLTWAGLACSEAEPCPIYLELAGVIPNGKKILLSGNLHSSSGTLYSILLMSEDSGEKWTEPARRIRGASLEQLQFYDFQSGWAAGETLYPLAHDPFFLVTTDGGTSWNQQAVTDEGGPGTIQRFWFDSPLHGELVVDHGKSSANDRFALYESQTGGQSWNILATSSKLPVIRRAPPATDHADWRIRNSKDGNAYEIQKRTGERWTPVAAFLVKVADCKPGQQELKEPSPADSTEKKDYVEELKLKTDSKAPAPKKKKP